MISRLIMATVCALCIQTHSGGAEGFQQTNAANGKGRFTLCIAGFVETRMGCLPQGSVELSAPVIRDMKACMSQLARSLQGYRSQYLRCSQTQSQKARTDAP